MEADKIVFRYNSVTYCKFRPRQGPIGKYQDKKQ